MHLILEATVEEPTVSDAGTLGWAWSLILTHCLGAQTELNASSGEVSIPLPGSFLRRQRANEAKDERGPLGCHLIEQVKEFAQLCVAQLPHFLLWWGEASASLATLLEGICNELHPCF